MAIGIGSGNAITISDEIRIGDERGTGTMDPHHPASRIVISGSFGEMRIGNENAMRIGAMDRHHPASPIAISGTIRGMWIDRHLPCAPS